jgi:hypothetical protein
MDVSMERSHGRAIGLAVIVIAVFVVGEIWRPDHPVAHRIRALWDQIASGSPPATQLPGDDRIP